MPRWASRRPCAWLGLERCMTPGGSSMVVIGGGLIGQLTLAFAKARGIGVSILSDPVPARREQALRAGAEYVHDPAAGPLQELVAEVTDGRGIDLAVEAVGKPELVDLAIQVARPRGEVLILGVSPKGDDHPERPFRNALQGTDHRQFVWTRGRLHKGDQPAGADRFERRHGRPLPAAPRGGGDAGRSERHIEVREDFHRAAYGLGFSTRLTGESRYPWRGDREGNVHIWDQALAEEDPHQRPTVGTGSSPASRGRGVR